MAVEECTRLVDLSSAEYCLALAPARTPWANPAMHLGAGRREGACKASVV